MIYNLTKYNDKWNTRKLRKLGDFSRGKSKHRPRNDEVLYEGGGYPFIQTGDIKAANLFIDSHEQEYNEIGLAQSELWPAGTLAITIAANIAETGILDYPMCFPDSVVGFTANPKETTELYMHYIFAYIRASVQKSVGGSIQDNINIDYLENLDFKIPDINVQRRMLDVLATLDKKIYVNTAITTELEKTAKLLYNYWFVQFDFPNVEGNPYRQSGGEMAWNDRIRQEIPKGWQVGSVGDLYEVLRGTLITEKEARPGKIKVVAAGLEHSYCHSEANRSPNTITISGSGANAGFVRLWRENIFASDCITVRGENDIDTLIIYQYLNFMQKIIMKKATGSAQPHVYPDDIKTLLFFDVPDGLKRQMADYYIPINTKITKLQQENNELIALRDFLLPLLMNGQVTVAKTKTTKTSSVAEASDAEEKRRTVFKRLVLSAYILDTICDEPTAGRVKFEKLLYLSEHCAKIPLHSEFRRAAAGPYDSAALYSIENQLKKNKWFKRQKSEGDSRAYTRLENSSGYAQYLDANFDNEQKSMIDRLLHLFKIERTITCEIVATLYGAWNDFLLEGMSPTDNQIVDEVMTNWHESKERIERDRWFKALEWMRQNDIVPTGYGVSTKSPVCKSC